MRSFQENLSIFTDNTTNLLIQISELNELREQLRKAQLSARRSQQPMPMPMRQKKNANWTFSTSLKTDS
jgi:hypothetical protein